MVHLVQRRADVDPAVGRPPATGEIVEVGTGGERAPRARHADGAHLGVLGGVADGVEQIQPELVGPGVQRLGPVQADDRGGAAAFELHGLVHTTKLVVGGAIVHSPRNTLAATALA